jgi:hypothetical protein
MPDARPWRRGQAPKPHRGALKAQGLTAAIAVATPSLEPSIAPDDPVSLNVTSADTPMNAFAAPRIYTSLTGTGDAQCVWREASPSEQQIKVVACPRFEPASRQHWDLARGVHQQ